MPESLKGYIPYILLLCAGLLMSVGYLIYSKYYSGQEVVRQTIFKQDVSHSRLGPIKRISSSNPQWLDFSPVELSSDMNPLSVIAHINYVSSKTGSSDYFAYKNEYVTTLSYGNSKIWEESFSLSKDRTSSSESSGSISNAVESATISTFSVQDSGAYSLNIRQTKNKGPAVKKIDISIRRNVSVANMLVVGIGAVIAFLSVLKMGLIQNSRKKKIGN